MEKDNKGYMVYPPTQRLMFEQNQSVDEATALKGDIVSALSLSGTESVYVTGRDSNGAKPMAWANVESLDKRTLPKLEKLGWELVTAGAKKRKVCLVLQFNGVPT